MPNHIEQSKGRRNFAMTDRPLRFCMITTFYPPYNFGGDGIFVRQLSNELARRGHHVEVIHCIDSYRLMAGREPIGTYNDHPNVTVHGLRSRFGFLSPLATQQTGLPLFKLNRIREVLEQPFDVIHYHNISLVGGPKILEYGRAIKLYTMHEYWLICPTHVLFKFNRAACTRPHCLPCTFVYKRPPQIWRYTRFLETAVRHVDSFIAPSVFSKEIHQRMGLDMPIVHVPLFVSPNDDRMPPTGELEHEAMETPYFLFVGRLEKLKGLQTLIPSFRRYPKARLLIAGTGNYESKLKHMAERGDNIEFLGHVSGEPLRNLYRRAVALIIPSICYDTSPLVALEAFREQTPAIVRNLGGMPEIVAESGGGFIYNNEEELVGAMDKLLQDPLYRRQLGLNGYNAYLEMWTPEAHLKRYFELIGDIAATRGHTRARGSNQPYCSDRSTVARTK
jgi:glycosyltransferase involved in cell wall biosynthesis